VPTLLPISPAEQSLVTLLLPSHEEWVREARGFLEPALEPATDFWTRWAAARYLSDGFETRYRLERALVDQLHQWAPGHVGARLIREGELLGLRRLEMERLGRRRGTAAEMAAVTEQLLEQLATWLASIELATTGLRLGDLPAEAAEILTRLGVDLYNEG
jgi:hypothetical protein